MNELFLLLLLAIGLILIYVLYKKLDKRGLYFAIVILNIMTFIFLFKISYIFKMNVNIGIIPFILVLNIVYIYIIKYGNKEIKNLEIVSLYTNISTALLLVIMNYYIPAVTETVSINMIGTFEYNYKILITYPIIMFLSQYIVIKLYSFISKLQNNTVISIILTYIITALVYTVIFYIICYIKILSLKDSIFIGITTYIVGLVIMLLYAFFIKMITGSKKVTKWEMLS